MGRGPLPSMGLPKASTMRPSQPMVGRTPAASDRMRISATGETPSTGPTGMSRARASRKPTTSAGRGCSARRSISARAPTARRVRPPRASIKRPLTAATRPDTVRGSMRSTAAMRLRKATGPETVALRIAQGALIGGEGEKGVTILHTAGGRIAGGSDGEPRWGLQDKAAGGQKRKKIFWKKKNNNEKKKNKKV